MTLNEVLKNTNYDVSLFSEEARKFIEEAIVVNTVRGKETPFITCLKRGKEIVLKPEEAVRQLYLYKLIHEYGYPTSRIEVEFPIHFGREVKRADIAIMDKDRPMVPYIIVELKKPKLSDGKEQLKSYCNATGAPIGVWTNGEQISYYNRKDPNYFEPITNIPKVSEKLSDIINEKFTYEDLKKIDRISQQKRSLRSLIQEMEDEVLASAGVDSFEEIFKLIFAKLYVNEIQFMRDFYNGIMSEVSGILRHYLDNTLPSKGYNQTVNGKIRDACLRLNSALNVKFDYNYKYPHEVGALDDPNSYAIVYQLPFNGFGRIEPDNIYSANEGVYSQLIATKGVDWFASYVYSLRNALFHEIITPLDEEWQTIFKSAYLVLKQMSDVCIATINRIIEFPQSQENAVFDYVTAHHDNVFSALADSVELLDYPKMTLNNWKIDHGKTILKGWFLAKLKLQNGTAEDIKAGAGSIEEVDKGFDFEVTLNDDFSIAHDSESNTDRISIQLQGA